MVSQRKVVNHPRGEPDSVLQVLDQKLEGPSTGRHVPLLMGNKCDSIWDSQPLVVDLRTLELGFRLFKINRSIFETSFDRESAWRDQRDDIGIGEAANHLAEKFVFLGGIQVARPAMGTDQFQESG